MRNQFRKPKKCELRHSLYTEKLSLQVIYANEVSIYDLQRCMNWLNIIFGRPIQHLRSSQADNIWALVQFEQLWNINVKPQISVGTDSISARRQSTKLWRFLMYVFYSAKMSYLQRLNIFIDILVFSRDLSVVPLCENFAHLRSLVFTFISHSCSYWVEAYICSLRSHI